MLKYLLLIILTIACFATPVSSQYDIKGVLQDSNHKWGRIHLEYIQSIDDLNSLRADNVINTDTISNNGDFQLKGFDLPKSKRLYRLFLMEGKKTTGNYGISNGSWKNFIHIVLDNDDQLEMFCSLVNVSFSNCKFRNSKENRVIAKLYDEIFPSFFPKSPSEFLPQSETKKQFLYRKKTDVLKTFSDTCAFLIPSLIALNSLPDLYEEVKNDPEYFKDFILKIKREDPKSPYVIEMKNKLKSLLEIHFGEQEESSFDWIKFGLLGLILGLLGYIVFLHKKLKEKIKSINQENLEIPLDSNLIEKLSTQEKKVLQLISDGKTNKEIAQILFIETATVKSHINKLYHKLNVNNRKEASKFGKML